MVIIIFLWQAEVISPSEDLLNNQVINDFDIEEEEIMIENRYGLLAVATVQAFFPACHRPYANMAAAN